MKWNKKQRRGGGKEDSVGECIEIGKRGTDPFDRERSDNSSLRLANSCSFSHIPPLSSCWNQGGKILTYLWCFEFEGSTHASDFPKWHIGS